MLEPVPFTFKRVTMKFSRIYRCLQASIFASAALLMLPAGAQTATPDTPAATTAPAAQATPATPRAQHRAQNRAQHRADRRNARHNMAPRHSRTNSVGEPPNASRLATDRGATAEDYERNALARCEVFKTQEQKMACVERMRQTPQGSVEGGGLLWEYSYEVPANGS